MMSAAAAAMAAAAAAAAQKSQNEAADVEELNMSDISTMQAFLGNADSDTHDIYSDFHEGTSPAYGYTAEMGVQSGAGIHDMDYDEQEGAGNSMEDIHQQMLGDHHQQQEQQVLQNHLEMMAAAEALLSRPKQQSIMIAQNGTILGVTETVTGHPPQALLMTSAFDSIHYDDLLGLHAIKSNFWDKGIAQVEVCFRRKTLEGTWIWLVSKAVSFIEDPVAGMVLNESRAEDESAAAMSSRLTRISALMMHAVKEAIDWKIKEDQSSTVEVDAAGHSDHTMGAAIPGLADDAVALQALLTGNTGYNRGNLSNTANPLQELMDAAAKGGAIHQDHDMGKDDSGKTDDGARNTKHKSTDVPSVLDLVRSGPCADLSKVELTPTELKLVILVLKGQLKIDQLAPLILDTLTSPNQDLQMFLQVFQLEYEKNQVQENSQHFFKKANRPATPEAGNLSCRNRDFIHSLDNLHAPKPWSQFGNKLQQRTSLPGKSSALSYSLHSRRSFNSNTGDSSIAHSEHIKPPLHKSLESYSPPHLMVINLSYSRIGNQGMEMLSEILYCDTSSLKTLDVSFCGIEERGILAMCRSLRKRKKKNIPGLQGLLLTGNTISYKGAKELGASLAMRTEKKSHRKREHLLDLGRGTGYDEDDEFDGFDDEDDDELLFGSGGKGTGRKEKKEESKSSTKERRNSITAADDKGLQLLHLGCTNLTANGLFQLLVGLGKDSMIRELSIPSNNIGEEGLAILVAFLEGKGLPKYKRGEHVMPKLDRLDLSNNGLGNDGTKKLTRLISKRGQLRMVDLYLSFNDIGSGGIETIMNKLLQHNLVTLSLDNNIIGDRGCQLVAASLTSMHHLSRLNLSFNQIGSRGVTSLMRALIACESITYLGLSGNVMKISGAIAMGFALAQHPRLADLELDNCCLSQVAQCHIIAGIISNRWVPMQKMNGFRAGPPMVAMGALEVVAQHLCNEECFSIRRNIQMKTILQWMESNRAAKMANAGKNLTANNLQGDGNDNFLTVDFVSNMTDVNGTPSQSAYLRMLDRLSRIPFDEDELNDLRRYFYDADDGGDGLRGSDGNINLKHRGDLLAALGSEVADEIRDSHAGTEVLDDNPVGLVIDSDNNSDEEDTFGLWNKTKKVKPATPTTSVSPSSDAGNCKKTFSCNDEDIENDLFSGSTKKKRRHHSFLTGEGRASKDPESLKTSSRLSKTPAGSICLSQSSVSSSSKQSVMSRCGSEHSTNSHGERKYTNALKARITMFPQFSAKLDLLKASAQEMMDNEEDPGQQDIIAQQFAEASLTLLRQLRYHCMNSGLDGWRQGKIRRKVLIVDDSIVTRKMVARAFEKANFIVDTAENGMEGVAKLKESIYDIAFMDIDMPVMNGFDATKALRDWEDAKRPGARQPICALTAAYVDDFERSELMKFKEAGLDVMESKPCNIPRLFKVVDDVSPMFSDLSISVTQLPKQNDIAASMY